MTHYGIEKMSADDLREALARIKARLREAEPRGAPQAGVCPSCGYAPVIALPAPPEPQGAPRPGATTVMFDGSEVMGTPVKGAPHPPCGSGSEERCIHGSLARSCRGNR